MGAYSGIKIFHATIPLRGQIYFSQETNRIVLGKNTGDNILIFERQRKAVLATSTGILGITTEIFRRNKVILLYLYYDERRVTR